MNLLAPSEPTRQLLSAMAERIWLWIGHVIPCGAGWMLNGRWNWQRRLGAWWLQWWGWAFFYSKPWRPGSFDDR